MSETIYKEVKFDVLLKLKARKATQAPPVGTILGPTGIDIQKFCEDFNIWSKDKIGIIDVGVIVFDDLSYDILTKEQYLAFKKDQFDVIISSGSTCELFK